MTKKKDQSKYIYNIKFIWKLNKLSDGPFDIKILSEELNLSKDKALFLLNKKVKDYDRFKLGYRPEIISTSKV